MTREAKIDIGQHNGQKVVDTYELYIKMGLDVSNYSRWIRNARARGGKDIDWFINADLLKKNRRIKQRYYFTLDFARAMCINYKTKGSNELVDHYRQCFM
jgi:phage anti-repressor protein